MKRADRLSARDRWVALAYGTPDAETLAWVAEVAKKVLEADRNRDANTRRLELVRALGLTGSGSTDAFAIRTFLAATKNPLATREDRREFRDFVRMAFAFGPEISDPAIEARIKRALSEKA